jgi:hypothetical protein
MSKPMVRDRFPHLKSEPKGQPGPKRPVGQVQPAKPFQARTWPTVEEDPPRLALKLAPALIAELGVASDRHASTDEDRRTVGAGR